MKVGFVLVLVSEAADFDINEFGEFAGEVIHVDAGPAVDGGGIRW